MYRAVVVITALALSPGSLAAQVSIDTALGRLDTGQFVRARTLDGGRIQSRVSAVDRDPLGLRMVGQPQPLSAGSIDSLWVRGNAIKTGWRRQLCRGLDGFLGCIL